MRETKFRGFSKELNKWFYGSLDTTLKWIDFIVINIDGFSIKNRVESESIGEYSGLKDKDNNDIYEGDILKMENVYGEIRAVVSFEKGKFVYKQQYVDKEKSFLSTDGCTYDLCFDINPYEVIGNMHDNPELLNK